jgi:hypothetical protein
LGTGGDRAGGCVRQGQNPANAVALKNISRQTVRYVDTSWTWDYRIEVIGPDGEPSAKTKEGARYPRLMKSAPGILLCV